MLLDLTLCLSSDNPIFRQVLPPDLSPLLAAGHVGTHLDTLLHRPIPLEWMDRTGVLIDARPFGAEIGPQAVTSKEIIAGDFVIFLTGHIGRHPYGSDAYIHDHPQLTWPLIEALAGRGVSFIGIDGPGLRRGAEHPKVDQYCEEHGAYVIENLAHLEELHAVAPPRFPVRVAWIAHEGRTGLPVKIVAAIPDQKASA